MSTIFSRKDDESAICGLAVDIGTTTVSALIIDMETGKILGKASAGNGQIRYGADVINRIIESTESQVVSRNCRMPSSKRPSIR